MANSIVLKGCGVRQEAIGSGVIKPGYLVALDSNGKFVAHSSAKAAASKRFAIENDLEGKGISDSYANGDLVQANVMQPGDEIQAYLKNAEDVDVGEFLESAGDGTLQAYTNGVPLAIAKEAKVASGAELIKIEII